MYLNQPAVLLRPPSPTTTPPVDLRDRWDLALPRGRHLRLGGKPLVMGVLNLTPDSFSDGGELPTLEHAVERGLDFLRDGADLLDLGGESTRPGGGVYGDGASWVPIEEEIERCIPVIERLRDATDLPLSIDTRKAAVADAALEAGADIVNDISALGDPDMGALVARAGCPVVLMHSRGELATMQNGISYDEVMGEIRDELADAVARAEMAGIDPAQLIVDPGIGFGKTVEHNLTILRRLDDLAVLGRPILVGASRKSFLGTVTGREVAERLPASLAAAAWAASRGAAILRVHDVRETVDLLSTWDAIEEGSERGSEDGV